jgi:hypothetical protein
MKQLNFLLIFSFGLAMVMFTMENTAATTVQFLPGVSFTLPLAAMLLLVGGLGATAAWVFAVWSGVDGSFRAELEAELARTSASLADMRRGLATGLSLTPLDAGINLDALVAANRDDPER